MDKGAKTAPPPSTPVRPKKSKSKAKSRIAPTQMTQIPTPEPTPEPDDVYSAYVSPLLSLSYGKKIVPFEQWSSELQPHFQITKIAEASFSEVYRLSATTTSPDGITQESVLKLIGLKTPPDAPLPSQTQARAVRDRNGQLEKELEEREEKDAFKSHVADVLSEVRLLQNLTSIPGFTIFRDLTILQGRSSSLFNAAWTKWNKARPRGKKSYFPDPSKKASYDSTQLWAVVEMQDAGTDVEKLMENGGLASVWAVWDVFWGVCASVAKAEEVCGFEHRDLHLGNICVRSSRPDADVQSPEVEEPLKRKMGFTGLETTVIDYTLSRAEIVASSSQRPTPSSSTLDVAYLDLDKDPALFQGDAQEEYQYEIYRYMRGVALYDNPLQQEPTPTVQAPRRSPRKNTHIRFEETATIPDSEDEAEAKVDVWRSFHPRTNLVWAHFLLHKLLAHLETMNAIPTASSSKHSSESANEDDEKISKKATKLYKILVHVSELLCPMALGGEGSLGGVKELVVLAIEERWLRVGDVRG
ncbi:hypothetical protein P153DRAFT_302447 [Dothidotthia symphoricarpi CBS 119687]|uniref:non-specific serine/threonine protein kinase n=1 Tax=Dothidotthia symphoricarpi CBS 119687 TaxID=1392245 RepID=A0A6A5ZZY1_9PLEO|nr:uncharacterized protein P153DRAFT_302447 [Dothidotthia symphoricarpi CBS 119687]KAF2124267.1 hypothetical protein P153DRAFT_302447 [Dothidotthia symphoricarpi CBS 119687]